MLLLPLMWRWWEQHTHTHTLYQISVIFPRLTRLSTSRRYEPIKGVFHTATTRSPPLIAATAEHAITRRDRTQIVTFADLFSHFSLPPLSSSSRLPLIKECGIRAGKRQAWMRPLPRPRGVGAGKNTGEKRSFNGAENNRIDLLTLRSWK